MQLLWFVQRPHNNYQIDSTHAYVHRHNNYRIDPTHTYVHQHTGHHNYSVCHSRTSFESGLKGPPRGLMIEETRSVRKMSVPKMHYNLNV